MKVPVATMVLAVLFATAAARAGGGGSSSTVELHFDAAAYIPHVFL